MGKAAILFIEYVLIVLAVFVLVVIVPSIIFPATPDLYAFEAGFFFLPDRLDRKTGALQTYRQDLCEEERDF